LIFVYIDLDRFTGSGFQILMGDHPLEDLLENERIAFGRVGS
jgi:hypothetical protein